MLSRKTTPTRARRIIRSYPSNSGVNGWFPAPGTCWTRLWSRSALSGAGLGLTGAGLALLNPTNVNAWLEWSSLGLNLCLHLDGLAAFFLVPIFLLVFSGALYASGYLQARDFLRVGVLCMAAAFAVLMLLAFVVWPMIGFAGLRPM